MDLVCGEQGRAFQRSVCSHSLLPGAGGVESVELMLSFLVVRTENRPAPES